MKNILKITACAAFVFAVSVGFAQQATTTKSHAKKTTAKKEKGIDNKIAVSDQAQTSDKSKGSSSRKDNGLSNK